MEIINQKDINFFAHSIKENLRHMPLLHLTETIPLDQSLGRKLAEDVYSQKDYPELEQASVDGFILNIQGNIVSIEQFNALDRKTIGRLGLGENPYIPKNNHDFISPITSYRKIGSIANTVISEEQHDQWKHAVLCETGKTEKVQDIQKGLGLIPIGSLYKKGQIVLNKNSIISHSKKALLKQAGILELSVYKMPKLAVLKVSYDLEYFNNDLEFDYIKNCMSSWGFNFDVLNIKPCALMKPNETSEISINITDFSKKIDEILKEYDYVVACGLPSQFYFRQIGLNRLSGQGLVPIKYGIPSDHKDYIVGSGYTLFKSRIKKSPTVRVTVREYNDDGWYIGNREIVYEDYPMISFLPGHIFDVIINMHVYTKPHLYHRVYAEAVLPEWKLGILTEDFTMKASRAVAYLWAQSFVVSYEDPRWPKVHSIPQLKILNIKDRHHPE